MLNQILFSNSIIIHQVHPPTEEGTLTLEATTIRCKTQCPACQRTSQRVHSRYHRTIADLPLAGHPVAVQLQVRRYFCDNAQCPRRIFAERLPEFVAPYARPERTVGLNNSVRPGSSSVAKWVLSCCIDWPMPTSGPTLLRLLRTMAGEVKPAPRVVGIDDWAWAKGQRYGTVLVDLERHQAVDLLPDRSADTVAAWLKAHPEVEIISRDRAQIYIDGIGQGAPEAIQVADRWHLLKNWRETLERLLNRQPACLRAAVEPQPVPITKSEQQLSVQAHSKRSSLTKAEQRREANHQQRLARFQTVVKLHQQGLSQKMIAQRVGLSPKTVHRYLWAGHLPKLNRRRRPGLLAPYLEYLERRWQIGCHNGAQLFREIKAQGYAGGQTIVADWAAKQRKLLGPAHSPTKNRKRPWSARAVSWLLVKPPESLKPEQQQTLKRVLQASEPVRRAYGFGQAFGRLVRYRLDRALAAWLKAALASDIAELRRFARGLVQDQAAVLAALTLPWSQGQVEGQVNRLKLLKRQMFGRAKFDLLKLRFLAT